MVRAGSPAASALVLKLRDELARDLPLQQELLLSEGELSGDDPLLTTMREGLPVVRPRSSLETHAMVRRYLVGPCHSDAVATGLVSIVNANPLLLEQWEGVERQLIESRLIHLLSWSEVAQRCGFVTIREAQRALRRVMRRFCSEVGVPL